jgi:hypothetical protein
MEEKLWFVKMELHTSVQGKHTLCQATLPCPMCSSILLTSTSNTIKTVQTELKP